MDLRLPDAIDRHAEAVNRLAAAVERLATTSELAAALQQVEVATTDCVRCSGQGWLGHPQMPCPACDGAGRVPA